MVAIVPAILSALHQIPLYLLTKRSGFCYNGAYLSINSGFDKIMVEKTLSPTDTVKNSRLTRTHVCGVRLELLVVLGLMLSILLVYGPVGGYDFVNFDDDAYVYDNRFVRSGLTKESVVWAFKNVQHMCWQPLAWMSHMLDIELYGLEAGRHHLTNVLLHVLNSMLLFYLLYLLTGSLPKSALVAFIFALHPLNVDTVAWISERKNLLSAGFGFLAVISYGYYYRSRHWYWLLVSTCMYALGLMSKPMLVVLPFVLLLLDYWPLGRLHFSRRSADSAHIPQKSPASAVRQSLTLMLEKTPFFFLTLIYLYLFFFSVEGLGGLLPTETVSPGLRWANVFISYIRYGMQLLRPADMAVFHPFPVEIPLWKTAGALLGLIATTGLLAVRWRKDYPFFIVGWLWFVGSLVPVIGVIQMGNWPAIAERWVYFPMVGFFVAIIWGGDVLRQHLRYRAAAGAALAMAFVLVLALVASLQVRYWKNSVTLFAHAAKVTENNFLAYDNLGLALVNEGQLDEALLLFKKSYDIKPNNYRPLLNMGAYFLLHGKPEKAIQYLRSALDLNPYSERIYINLGRAYLLKGDQKEARTYFELALKKNPYSLNAKRYLERLKGASS
jgi:hypothetical protein